MHIGIVTGEYPPMQGGVGAYTSILAGELARQGQKVSILSVKAARNSDPQLHLQPCIETWSLGSLGLIKHWAKEQQLDVLNLQFQTAAFNMSPWIHFLPDYIRSIPLVTTFHDLRFPYLFPKAGGLRPWIVQHLARASKGIIVTNHEDEVRLHGLGQNRLIPIGSNILKALPLDFDREEWRAKAQAGIDDFLIAYFGLFNQTKGLHILLESLALLRKNGVPARLVLVGGGSGSSDPTNRAYFEDMTRLVARLELKPYVFLTGYLEDESEVGAYLKASDAVALPFLDGASYRRGSLMAALHYGCPIVTTTPQVKIPPFRDGETMCLVPPGDPAALQQALQNLCKAPEQREHLGQRAKQLAGQFEWASIAREMIDFLRQVVA